MPKHYAVGSAATGRREPGRLYDEYGAALYGYCWSVLADADSAADAVAHAVRAAAPALPGPRLSTLLFRLARDECLRVGPSTRGCYAGRRRTTPLATLVANAVGELATADRDVLELSVRHRFHGAELAAVLDVAPASADELAARTARRFRQVFSTLVLAASGALAVPRELAADPPPLPVLLGMLTQPPPPAGLRLAVTAAPADGARSAAVPPGHGAVPRPRRPDPAERQPATRPGLPPGVQPVTPATPWLSPERVAWARDRHPAADTDAAGRTPHRATPRGRDARHPNARHRGLRWASRLGVIAGLAGGAVLVSGGPLW